MSPNLGDCGPEAVKQDFFEAARACLAEPDPARKGALTASLCTALRSGEVALVPPAAGRAFDQPGRPERPHLVPPRELPRRRLNTVAGRAALLHALAHIEFNAINLAWDAVCRFGGMPADFYRDWASVADEEAYHFRLLRERLQTLGFDYGDFPAHNGLWEMALKTRDDVMVRMALVPRVLEARGLDVSPAIIGKLHEAGDEASVEVLNIILRDEIGHVAIGTRWFRYACERRGLDPRSIFRALLEQHMPGRVKGPFFREARMEAGFTPGELDDLESLDKAGAS